MADPIEEKINLAQFDDLPNNIIDSDYLHVGREGEDFQAPASEILKKGDIKTLLTDADTDKPAAASLTKELKDLSDWQNNADGIVFSFGTIWTVVRNGNSLTVSTPSGKFLVIDASYQGSIAVANNLVVPNSGGIVLTVSGLNGVLTVIEDLSTFTEGESKTKFIIAKNLNGVLRTRITSVNQFMYNQTQVVVGLSWDFDSTTAEADPGAGKFRGNNVNPALITEFYFSKTAKGGEDVASILNGLPEDDELRIAQVSNATNYFIGDIGVVVDNTGYVKVPVTQTDTGNIFDNTQECDTNLFLQQEENNSDITRNYLETAVSVSQIALDFASKNECWATKAGGGGIVVNENIAVILANSTNKKASTLFIEVQTSAREITLDSSVMSNDSRFNDSTDKLTLEPGDYELIFNYSNGNAFLEVKPDNKISSIDEDITPQLGGDLDANFKRILESQGDDIASANNLTLDSTLNGNTYVITGTTQINLIEILDWQDGSEITLQFSGILTLKSGFAVSGDFAPIYLAKGGDYITIAGDVLSFKLINGEWFEIKSTIPLAGSGVANGGVSNAAQGIYGNKGFNTADIEAWNSTYGAFEFPFSAIMYNKTNNSIYILSNTYYDGDWKYKADGFASRLTIRNGEFSFDNSITGLENGVITWKMNMAIGVDGNLLLKKTPVTDTDNSPLLARKESTGEVVEIAQLTKGTDNQIPVINSAGDDFEYTDNFQYIAADRRVKVDLGLNFGAASRNDYIDTNISHRVNTYLDSILVHSIIKASASNRYMYLDGYIYIKQLDATGFPGDDGGFIYISTSDNLPVYKNGDDDTLHQLANSYDRSNSSVASSATLTPTGNKISNKHYTTALAEGATYAVPSGTPANGNEITGRVKDDGTPQTLAFNAIYRAIGVTLPSTTVANKTLYWKAIYNSDDSKWDVLTVNQEA